MLGRVQGKNVPVGITHTVRNYAVTVIVLNVALTFVFGAVDSTSTTTRTSAA